jgi:hypothetical protein|tara:strand:+ start:3635 stop:3766 length:132 start_codon:yes stop_codon:yes gene_type:complete
LGAAPSEPSVTHISRDYRSVARRIVRRSNNVAGGVDDRRKTLT